MTTRLYHKPVVDFRVGHEEGIGLVFTDRGRPHYIFVTGYDRLGHAKQQNLLMILLVANVGGMLIIIAGWLRVGRFLSPLVSMVDGVQQISGAMHLRLNERNRKDEIARLAMTFNQMLTQLEDTFASQQQFVSHTSHELRTPLTTMLGTLDFAVLRYEPGRHTQQDAGNHAGVDQALGPDQ